MKQYKITIYNQSNVATSFADRELFQPGEDQSVAKSQPHKQTTRQTNNTEILAPGKKVH